MTTPDNDQRGIVYILTNESMPGCIKIGETGGNSPAAVQKRMRGLDSTGVPRPFDCAYAAVVADRKYVEDSLHEVFGDRRIRPTREFFEGVEVHRVIRALQMVAELEVTPGETPELDEEGQAVQVKPPKRPPLTFPMVRIDVGAELHFIRDEKVTCTVEDDRHVRYQNKTTALSPLTQELLGYSRSPAGADYWMYEGETLNERRRRMESEGTGEE